MEEDPIDEKVEEDPIDEELEEEQPVALATKAPQSTQERNEPRGMLSLFHKKTGKSNHLR